MNNISKIRKAVGESELDALLLTGEFSRLYATGFQSSAGIVLVTEEKAWFFTDSRYFEAAEKAVDDAVVRLVSNDLSYYALINEVIAASKIKYLGFEEETLTVNAFKKYEEKLSAVLVPAQKTVNDQRAVKKPHELEQLKKAQRIAEKSFEEILSIISTDMTERELAAELQCRFLKNGADDKSFDPIVVSGVRSSMPHGVPTDNKLSRGFLTIDFGVKRNGWCSDTTRTVCIGEPTDEMRRVYDTVLKAQLCGISAAKAGVTGRAIDEAARKVIEEAGYGEFFGHGFGHGLGLEVHEAPSVSQRGDAPIPAGAVVSAEPGIYLPGRFGVRIEDVLYITETGCENITELPKELLILNI